MTRTLTINMSDWFQKKGLSFLAHSWLEHQKEKSQSKEYCSSPNRKASTEWMNPQGRQSSGRELFQPGKIKPLWPSQWVHHVSPSIPLCCHSQEKKGQRARFLLVQQLGTPNWADCLFSISCWPEAMPLVRLAIKGTTWRAAHSHWVLRHGPKEWARKGRWIDFGQFFFIMLAFNGFLLTKYEENRKEEGRNDERASLLAQVLGSMSGTNYKHLDSWWTSMTR